MPCSVSTALKLPLDGAYLSARSVMPSSCSTVIPQQSRISMAVCPSRTISSIKNLSTRIAHRDSFYAIDGALLGLFLFRDIIALGASFCRVRYFSKKAILLENKRRQIRTQLAE
jgi:hypothetical protein